MSDLAPPHIYYISYPLEDVISCDICNNNNEVREDARRQRGVFKAASRRQNYVLHLGRQHDVPAENVKIRCSVCGRVSNKPSRTAWRDIQTHHRRKHTARVQPVEAVGKVVEPPLVPNKAESSLHGQENKNVAAFHRPNINDVDEQEANIFSAAVNRKFSPIKIVGTGKITATIKEPKDLLPNKSTIMSGMGKMFDVVVDNDKFQDLIHSTPQGSRSTKASIVQQKTIVEMSRIVPKARPPVKRSLSSQFEMASPRKKFHSCVD